MPCKFLPACLANSAAQIDQSFMLAISPSMSSKLTNTEAAILNARKYLPACLANSQVPILHASKFLPARLANSAAQRDHSFMLAISSPCVWQTHKYRHTHLTCYQFPPNKGRTELFPSSLAKPNAHKCVMFLQTCAICCSRALLSLYVLSSLHFPLIRQVALFPLRHPTAIGCAC